MNVVPGKVQPGQRAPAETGYLTLTWDCEDGATGETGELMTSVAVLRNMVPLAYTDPEMQTFFREKQIDGQTVGQAGLQVIYADLDQLERAYKELVELGKIEAMIRVVKRCWRLSWLRTSTVDVRKRC